MRDAEIDRLEHVVGRVLRIGSMASAAILAVGLLLSLARPDSAIAIAIIRVGLLVLISTPVARVVASVIDYTRDRDWLFAGLTFLVLVIVLGSLVFGIAS